MKPGRSWLGWRVVVMVMGWTTALAADPASTSRPADGRRTRSAGPRAERVSFTTDEKVPVTVVGNYLPPPAAGRKGRAPMVILLHAEGEDRSVFDGVLPGLASAGLAVLAIDLRGHGESVEPASLKLRSRLEEHDPRVLREMLHDVEAARGWLAHRPETDPARFVVVGSGLGGGIALEYAALDKSVDGVVLLSPVMESPGPDLRVAARKYARRPLLVLVTESDRIVADALVRLVAGTKIQAAAGGRAGPADTSPATARLLGPSLGLDRALLAFLVESAGAPGDSPVVASLKGEVYYEPGSSQSERLSPDNARVFSSAAEAESRGYRPPRQRKR